jgi:hypothetical protein
MRAILDATGKGDLRGDGLSPHVREAARTWILGRGAEDLLSLAGLDSDVVLRQVRRVLDG